MSFFEKITLFLNRWFFKIELIFNHIDRLHCDSLYIFRFDGIVVCSGDNIFWRSPKWKFFTIIISFSITFCQINGSISTNHGYPTQNYHMHFWMHFKCTLQIVHLIFINFWNILKANSVFSQIFASVLVFHSFDFEEKIKSNCNVAHNGRIQTTNKDVRLTNAWIRIVNIAVCLSPHRHHPTFDVELFKSFK